MQAFRLFLLALFLMFSLSAQAANPQVEFRTNMGSFVVELYPDKAPKTVANFLEYVNSGFYDGTIFHRVINDFMIQGGGLTTDLRPKDTLPPIPNEANNGLRNEPGTLAMARKLNPNSATSQFFINLGDNKTLNYYRPEPDLMGYCVFGKVIRGMSIARQIGLVRTGPAGKMSNVPNEPIVIQGAALLDSPVLAEQEAERTPRAKTGSSSKSVKKGKTRG